METELVTAIANLKNTAQTIMLLVPIVGVALLVLRGVVGNRW